MKLKAFKEKNKKKIGIILFTITCILLITGVILYRTFAIFETNDKFNVINGSIEDVGDIYFAFYKDGVIQKDMPTKNDGYVLDEENSYCGVLGDYNQDIKVSMTEDEMIHVKGVTTSRTKCNLYFVKGVYILGKGIPLVTEGDGLYEVTHEEVTGTLNDQGFRKTEYRYAGSNPNNYIMFNNEPWRIIGLVNVMTSETTVEQRVKIVKNENIGKYSWDSSLYGAVNNGGRGINEWSQADLMTLLNNYYYSSLSNQLCYIDMGNQTAACDFSENGLKENYKIMIENIFWNVSNGKNVYNEEEINYKINTLTLYNAERSEHIRVCASVDDYCGDNNLNRTSTFQAKIGLIYPSDLGFATSTNEEITRMECYKTNAEDMSVTQQCYNNNYFINMNGFNNPYGYSLFTAQSTNGVAVTSPIHLFRIHAPAFARDINPSLYLKKEVKIYSGTGNVNDAYKVKYEIS